MSSLLKFPITDGKISAVYKVFFKIYVETYECESVHHSFIVK